MDREELAAGLGVVGCLAVLVLVGLPYLVTGRGAVSVYYDAGAVSPAFLSLPAVVAAVALLAGARDRSDPAVVAGVAVVLGALMALLALAWAVGVSPGVVGGLTTEAAFEYHRWALVAAGLGVAGASAWYARLVVSRPGGTPSKGP